MTKTFVKKVQTDESTITKLEKIAIDLKINKQVLYGKILEYALQNIDKIFKAERKRNV